MATARATLFLALAFSVLARAQEIKFVDLSAVPQRTALRYPPAEPRCGSDRSCVGGGVGGVSVADGASDRRDPHAVGVALDLPSATDITLDPFDAEFRIINTGLSPIEVPVSPHLSDLQPPDETKPFSYLSLSLVIQLNGPAEGVGLGWVELYGSTDHDGTVVALEPGQWVRMKAKVKLSRWPHTPMTVKLATHFWLRQNVVQPLEGGSSTQITNLYPNETFFPPISIRFTPTRGDGQQH